MILTSLIHLTTTSTTSDMYLFQLLSGQVKARRQLDLLDELFDEALASRNYMRAFALLEIIQVHSGLIIS